jgi:hypothetical protein
VFLLFRFVSFLIYLVSFLLCLVSLGKQFPRVTRRVTRVNGQSPVRNVWRYQRINQKITKKQRGRAGVRPLLIFAKHMLYNFN